MMIKYIALGSLIIYLILLIILVINMRKKNMIIKYSFIAFSLILLIALLIMNSSILDNIISIIIRYLYFPTLDAYLTTLMLTLSLLAYNIYNDYIHDKVRIINYIFAILIIISYIVFMLLKIDTNSYTKLYSENSLICLRYATRTFTIWILYILIKKGYSLVLSKKR